jgi:hypothetical protein
MWSDAMRHVALGWEIIIALALGWLLGWWLDRTLHTRPWLQIAGALLGLAAGVKALVQVVRDYRREVGPDDPLPPGAENLPAPALPHRRRRHRRHEPGGGADGASGGGM